MEKDNRENQNAAWIPITERLPNEDLIVSDMVLVAWPSVGVIVDSIGVGYYHRGRKMWYVDAKEWEVVTHWMPLPKPPHEHNTETHT